MKALLGVPMIRIIVYRIYFRASCLWKPPHDYRLGSILRWKFPNHVAQSGDPEVRRSHLQALPNGPCPTYASKFSGGLCSNTSALPEQASRPCNFILGPKKGSIKGPSKAEKPVPVHSYMLRRLIFRAHLSSFPTHNTPQSPCHHFHILVILLLVILLPITIPHHPQLFPYLPTCDFRQSSFFL